MADRTWYSRKQGDAVPTIHMEVRGNATYRQEFEFQPVDANNADTGNPEDFTNWSETSFRLVFSDAYGGSEISGATAVGGTDIFISGDATDGKLLVKLTTTQTAALEAHLETAGNTSRGTVKGRLYGTDGNGDTRTLCTAEVRVHFGTVAS